jgi:putative intracellular protease/amidase
MVQVQIILFNGFDELDAIIPFEVFQSAAAIGADVQAELVALDESMVITAAHGLRVQPEAKLAIDRQPNILIVPGGGWIDRAP